MRALGNQAEDGEPQQPNTTERLSGTQDAPPASSQAETLDASLPAVSELTSNLEPSSETQDTQVPGSQAEDEEYKKLRQNNSDFVQKTAKKIEDNEREISRLEGENKAYKKQLQDLMGQNNKDIKEQLRRVSTIAAANKKRQKTWNPEDPQAGPSTPAADQQGGDILAASRSSKRRRGGDNSRPSDQQGGDCSTLRQTQALATTAHQPSVPQHTTTQSAGIHTTAKSFNLSESESPSPAGPQVLTFSDVVHESARPALLRFKHDHAYSKCQCSWSCGESCFNKASLVACDEQTCRVEQSRCGNRWPEELKRNKPLVTVTEAGALGFGLKATNIIRKGDIFLYYFGQYIGTDEMIRRQTELCEEACYKKNGFIVSYYISLLDSL